MTRLKNDLFLKAIRREPLPMTPIWIMRQAGRYLPEYRALRKSAGSFMKLCKTPALAAEVTLQPINRYPLDAAIIFSDILTIPDAMGLGLEFIEGEGPRFHHPIRREGEINHLKPVEVSSLQYVYESIQLVQKELQGKVPLIGFCGSPFTLAAYMIQGEAKLEFPLLKKMMTDEPKLLHKLLAILAESIALHLNAQIQAGVQAVMIFDTWGGLLNRMTYPIFSLNYIKEIMSTIRAAHAFTPPIILFTKGSALFLDLLADTACDVVSVDFGVSLGEAKLKTNHKVALQGNMDPAYLMQTPDVIRQEVATILASFGRGSGHIFNLGHGITKDAPPEHVAVLIDAVHELSQAYHA